MPSECERIRGLFEQLVAEPLFPFPERGFETGASTDHGVYVVIDGKDRVAHVGRTLRGKKGLWQRLNDHLKGTSSFACDYLSKAHTTGHKKLRKKYGFRFLVVRCERDRALLENLAVGELCPLHLGTGKSLNAPV